MNAMASKWRPILVLAACALLAGCGGSGRVVSDTEAAQANLNLGIGYLRQGRPDLAVETLERALQRDSRLAPAHSALALAHDQLGNAREAEEHYARAVRYAPSDPTIANSYAVFLCRQNRWRDAEPYFQRAASNPNYTTPAAALTNAGTCALSAGDAESAEAYLRDALTRDPEFPDALAGLLELTYGQQSYLQARAFLQRYLDVRPATPSLLLMCFNIERELGNRAAAEECAQRLRRDFPEAPEVARWRQMELDGR